MDFPPFHTSALLTGRGWFPFDVCGLSLPAVAWPNRQRYASRERSIWGDPHALLAERIESLVSQEHAKWASGQEKMEKPNEQPTAKGSG